MLVAWGFILLIAWLDASFAWQNRHTMLEWESNPVMLLVVEHWGPALAIGLRLASVMIGLLLVCLVARRLAIVATSLITAAHVVLAFVYIAIALP